MASDGKSSPFGDGNGGAGMAKATPADLVTNPKGAQRGGLPRPMDWTQPPTPSKPGGASAAASMPNPASMPDGGASVFSSLDGNAGGPAKGSPATIGAPSGGKRSFRVSGG